MKTDVYFKCASVWVRGCDGSQGVFWAWDAGFIWVEIEPEVENSWASIPFRPPEREKARRADPRWFHPVTCSVSQEERQERIPASSIGFLANESQTRNPPSRLPLRAWVVIETAPNGTSSWVRDGSSLTGCVCAQECEASVLALAVEEWVAQTCVCPRHGSGISGSTSVCVSSSAVWGTHTHLRKRTMSLKKRLSFKRVSNFTAVRVREFTLQHVLSRF